MGPRRPTVVRQTFSSPALAALAARLSPFVAGLVLTVAIAVAARLLGAFTPLPAVFLALVAGMALSGPGSRARFDPGVALSARQILRIGVALLGLQVTAGDFVLLGPGAALVTLATLAMTLVAGTWIARLLGAERPSAMVSAGAVAICGASAALAIAAAMPPGRVREEEVARTVAGITIVGTAAMLLYPLLASWLGLSPVATALFLGASIHEVAQAVAAGFAVSPEVGELATIVKLLRVASLGLVVAGVSLLMRGAAEPGTGKAPLLPLFLLVFVALAAVASLFDIPARLASISAELSRLCLLAAIAALGIRTSFSRLVAAGSGPLVAIVATSALLAAIVLAGVFALR